MDNITLVGIAASAFTGTASIPQFIKIARSKKADDISAVMVLVLIAGLGLWVYYGILKEDWILLVANTIPCLVNMGILLLWFRYKDKDKQV